MAIRKAITIKDVMDFVAKPHHEGYAAKMDGSQANHPSEVKAMVLVSETDRILIPKELNQKCRLEPSRKPGFMFEWSK